MSNTGWIWANLNRRQLELLHEGEQTLGADILLAYQQDGSGSDVTDTISQNQLKAAPLDDSQLECLQGLENQLHAVVVAYQSS